MKNNLLITTLFAFISIQLLFSKTNYKIVENKQGIVQATKKDTDSLLVEKQDIKKVDKYVVKNHLPIEYVEAIKQLDIPEKKIIRYFIKYHNKNQYKFFNEVLYLDKKYSNLTKTDVYLLWGYTTNLFFRKMNRWLRQGVCLPKTTNISQKINKALAKIPTFTKSKVIYRTIRIRKNVKQFVSKYEEGTKHTWKAFNSCSSSIQGTFYYKSNILFEIRHLDAKEISDFSDGIKFRNKPLHELLIKAGSEFEVLSKPFKRDNLWVIQLVQTK